MLRSELLPSTSQCETLAKPACANRAQTFVIWKRRILPRFFTARGGLRVAAIVATALVLLATASAQDFSLQMTEFNPVAVDPGGNTSSNLTISPLNGFAGSVNLSCQVTSLQTDVTLPVCQVSPLTVTPPTGASVTITTPSVPAGTYTVTITGTGGSSTQTAARTMTVLSVTPSFTITVATVVSPTSVPAGGRGVANINVNPLNGYGGMVTLLCSAVSPVTVAPPVCNFNPQTVTLSSSSPSLVTLTLTTIGPTTPTTTSLAARKGLYALWLPLPMLVVFGVAAGAKRRRAWSLLALLVMGALVLLIPACSTTTTPQVVNDVNIVTPNGTYTFTVTGVDTTGATASNINSGGSSSITLTVTASPTN
jgi:hypothetical protein